MPQWNMVYLVRAVVLHCHLYVLEGDHWFRCNKLIVFC